MTSLNKHRIWCSNFCPHSLTWRVDMWLICNMHIIYVYLKGYHRKLCHLCKTCLLVMLSSDWFAKVSQFRMIVYLIWNKKLSDSKHVFGLRIDQIKSSLHRKLKFINFGIFFYCSTKGSTDMWVSKFWLWHFISHRCVFKLAKVCCGGHRCRHVTLVHHHSALKSRVFPGVSEKSTFKWKMHRIPIIWVSDICF